MQIWYLSHHTLNMAWTFLAKQHKIVASAGTFVGPAKEILCPAKLDKNEYLCASKRPCASTHGEETRSSFTWIAPNDNTMVSCLLARNNAQFSTPILHISSITCAKLSGIELYYNDCKPLWLNCAPPFNTDRQIFCRLWTQKRVCLQMQCTRLPLHFGRFQTWPKLRKRWCCVRSSVSWRARCGRAGKTELQSKTFSKDQSSP